MLFVFQCFLLSVFLNLRESRRSSSSFALLPLLFRSAKMSNEKKTVVDVSQVKLPYSTSFSDLPERRRPTKEKETWIVEELENNPDFEECGLSLSLSLCLSTFSVRSLCRCLLVLVVVVGFHRSLFVVVVVPFCVFLCLHRESSLGQSNSS
jgi:hypothetical protein